MEINIKIILKDEKIGFAVEKTTKSENELEDNLKIISALRLLAKHYEDKIVKKFEKEVSS